VTVALSSLDFGSLFVCFTSILFPVFKVRRVLDVLLQISDSAAIGAEEVGPCRPVQDGADALVMPDVRAGRNE
jgi:hypothetical protein